MIGGSSSSNSHWDREDARSDNGGSMVPSCGSESGGAGIAAHRRPAQLRAGPRQHGQGGSPPARLGSCDRGPHADDADRRRRDEPLEAWRRPPAWLYLPHLGLCGHGTDFGHAEMQGVAGGLRGDAQGSEGDEREETSRPTAGPGEVGRCDGALAPAACVGPGDERQLAQISGRGAAPGCGIRGRADALGRPEGNSGIESAENIEGRPARGAARRSAQVGRAEDQRAGTEEGRKARAQDRLDARNAGIAASLKDHADRVAKRDLAGDRRICASAGERIAAVRRRVEAKTQRQREQLAELSDHGGGSLQAAGRAGDDAPATGCVSQNTPPAGTKEVLKMHFMHVLQEQGIRMATAGTGVGDIDDGTMGNGLVRGMAVSRDGAFTPPLLNSAREAAASVVAWHTAVRARSSER